MIKMNYKEIELIDGFFNKGWCCDLDEVYKAIMKLQNNWNELKKWLEEIKETIEEVTRGDDWGHPCRPSIDIEQLLEKMQELEQGKDENNTTI